MVEALVLPRSRLIGSTLREARFLETTGLTVLAIHRAGQRAHVRNLSRAVLRAGDVLLAQGSEDALARLSENGMVLLDDLSAHHPRSPKGPWAAAIFVASLALGASGVLALPFAFLIGALALVLTRCITADEAYACVDWRLLVLIGSMMAFGSAMEKSGASAWIAQAMLGESSHLGPIAVMAGLYWMTVLLSQPMSNQAAALLVLPVAIQAARTLGIEPRPFVIAVTLAASCSFLTPLEPASVLVYGAGRYRFADFFRVGLPLTLLVFTITMFVVPHFWPITAAN